MWLAILIMIAADGTIHTHALPAAFPTEEKCRQIARGAEGMAKAMTDVADPAIFSTCYQLPEVS